MGPYRYQIQERYYIQIIKSGIVMLESRLVKPSIVMLESSCTMCISQDIF